MGQRYVWHHLIWATAPVDEGGDPLDASVTEGAVGWPVHEVGRNADIFDDERGPPAEGQLEHHLPVGAPALGRRRREVEAALRLPLPPDGLQAGAPHARCTTSATALDIDIKPNEANQQLHAYEVLQQPAKIVTFEPHLHAPGQRMCLEAIWGINIQTLTCAGYDHNWVRQYEYEDDYAPILPRGTILHIIGYMDNTPNNKNIPDPRNWQGSGNRSIANMFIDLGQIDAAHRRRVPGGDGEAPREARAEPARRDRRLSAVQRDSAAGQADGDHGNSSKQLGSGYSQQL